MSDQVKNIPAHPVYQSPIVLNFEWSKAVGLAELHEHNNLSMASETIRAVIYDQLWCSSGEKLTHAINWRGTPYEDQPTKDTGFDFAITGIRNENGEGTRLFVDALLTSPVVAPGPIILEKNPNDDQHRYEPDNTDIPPNTQISLFIDTDTHTGAVLAYDQKDYSVSLTPDPSFKINFTGNPIPLFLRPDINIAKLPIKWPDPKPAAPARPVEPAKPAANTDPDDD